MYFPSHHIEYKTLFKNQDLIKIIFTASTRTSKSETQIFFLKYCKYEQSITRWLLVPFHATDVTDSCYSMSSFTHTAFAPSEVNRVKMVTNILSIIKVRSDLADSLKVSQERPEPEVCEPHRTNAPESYSMLRCTSYEAKRTKHTWENSRQTSCIPFLLWREWRLE